MQVDGFEGGTLRASLHEPSPGCKSTQKAHPTGNAQETTLGVEPGNKAGTLPTMHDGHQV
jgi:hypothetical protein